MLNPLPVSRKAYHPTPANCPILGLSGSATGQLSIERLGTRSIALALRDCQSMLRADHAQVKCLPGGSPPNSAHSNIPGGFACGSILRERA